MARYSRAQLNAISRSYSQKAKKEQENKAAATGLDKVFFWQKKYKTMRGLLNASARDLATASAEALKNAKAREAQLISCGAPKGKGTKYESVKNDLKVIKSIHSNAMKEAKSSNKKK